jgi:hypothetical protein
MRSLTSKSHFEVRLQSLASTPNMDAWCISGMGAGGLSVRRKNTIVKKFEVFGGDRIGEFAGMLKVTDSRV